MTPLLHDRLRPGYGRRMKVPPNFRVHVFHPDAQIPGSAWHNRDDVGGQWVEVSGDPLPAPVLARIDRASDGRLIVTGLVLGHDNRREVTWETLRQVKPATILGLIFSGFDPDQPHRQGLEAALGGDQRRIRRTEPDLTDEDRELLGDADEVLVSPVPDREAAAFAIWERLMTTDPGPVLEVNKPRASVATDLVRFADVYRRHFASNPRRATTATATELHISRATAVRRIAECRQHGLLPTRRDR